jgi:outer membrane protein TolC
VVGEKRPFAVAALLAAALVLCSGATVRAQSLHFDTVLAKALKHSFDLKIAETDTAISLHRREEVRSLYYPTLTLQYYSEYIKALDDTTDEVVSAGDYVSTVSQSAFQNAVTAGLAYRLYDFGARGLRMENAEREVEIARHSRDQMDLDVRKDTLEAYARGLTLSRQIATGREIVDKRKEVFRQSQRLREAGTVGQQRVEKSALDLAEALSQVDDLRVGMQTPLARLGYLTGETYPLETTAFSDLAEPEQEIQGLPDVKRLPGVKAIEEEIVKKEAEYAIVQKEMLPVVSMQGAYGMFGSDPHNFSESFRNISERDASIAVVAKWEFFSGFRDQSKGKRLREEIKRLQLQKEKRLAELDQDTNALLEKYRLYGESRRQWDSRLSQIREARTTLKRLSDQQIMDRLAALENEIELLEQELDASLKRIERAVAAYKLQFLHMGSSR